MPLKIIDEYVAALAASVEARWRASEYRHEGFPEVADQSLEAHPPPAEFTASGLLGWGLGRTQIPTQLDPSARFGRPPVTLHHNDRFVIDAYFWLDGTTSIHEHSFCGAFQLLQGSSLHSRYGFHADDPVSERIAIGRLELRQLELLAPGDRRRIERGGAFIHAAFHLEHPTLTLTIRTAETVDSEPQLTYAPPSLAYDPFYEPPTLRRQVQLAAAALSLDDPSAISALKSLIQNADLFGCFKLLQVAVNHATSVEACGAFFDAASAGHGPRIDALRAALAEQLRRNQLSALRRKIKRPEHRFFLALLMNLPHRAAMLEAVKQAYPGADPLERLIGWMEELSHMELEELPRESRRHLFGFQFDDVSLLTLRYLLQGLDVTAATEAVMNDCRARGLAADPEVVRRSCHVLPKVAFVEQLFVDA